MIEAKQLLEEAQAIEQEIIEIRRSLHQNPEVGFDLTFTHDFVKQELEKLGLNPANCGRAGLIATVGSGARTFLLRADMDGLPVKEETDVDFAAQNGNMHACGHDMHAAMLLGAAKLLKAHENELRKNFRGSLNRK